MASFIGTSGDDVFHGGVADDLFDLSQGGGDIATGGSGSDVFDFGGALTSADSIDGGPGRDTVNLDGDYAVGLVLSAANFSNIDVLHLAGGHDYDITLPGNVLPDHTFAVFAASLGGDSLALDDTASLAGGNVTIALGAGALDLTGGAAREVITTSIQAAITADLGGGNDVVRLVGCYLTADIHLTGGAGVDFLGIDKAHANLKVDGDRVSGFETLVLPDSDCSVRFVHGVVDPGGLMQVMAPAGSVAAWRLDASHAVGGAFAMTGAGGDDTMIGSRGDDTLTGKAGYNTYIGGVGADHINADGSLDDTVIYLSLKDSTRHNPDVVAVTIGTFIDLSTIDADTTQGGDQAFTIVAAFTHHAGELTRSFDSIDGVTSISLDVDGDGKADSVIDLVGNHTDFSNFVL